MVVMASATVARELTKLAAACLRARQRCAAGPCGTASPMTTAMHGIEWALRKAKEALQSAMSSAAAGQAFDAMKPFPFPRMHNVGKSFMRD